MQIRDQARVEPSGTRWVDKIVLLSICAPRSITSISIPFPLDVDLPARLELHRFPLCLGLFESALKSADWEV